MDKRLAWHILMNDWRTNGDGYSPETQILVKVNEPLAHEGELVPCKKGLHASEQLIDALTYAAGGVITRVECSAPFVEHNGGDKFVCQIRKAIWGYNAEEELRLFARLCAKDALPNWKDTIPDVVLRWLETGDPELRSAARSAARLAAESAAWSAARLAAESAAESAARSAAESAARSAARLAARSAAESAARSAAWSAARLAAESAAESAAWSAQNERIEKLVTDGAIKRGLITLNDLKKAG